MSSSTLSTLLDDLELGTPPAKRTMDAAVTDLLHAIGEDPAREGLLKTPERVAKSLAFLTSGGDKTMADVLNGAVFTEDYDQMVLVKDIEFYSLCEHHVLPVFGKAHIAYLPADFLTLLRVQIASKSSIIAPPSVYRNSMPGISCFVSLKGPPHAVIYSKRYHTSLRSEEAYMGIWTIDPDHSVAAFAVKHLKIAYVRGQFNKISGTVTFDPADITKTAAEATIGCC